MAAATPGTTSRERERERELLPVILLEKGGGLLRTSPRTLFAPHVPSVATRLFQPIISKVGELTFRSVVLNCGDFAPSPSPQTKDTWQRLEAHLSVTVGDRESICHWHAFGRGQGCF